MKLKAVLDDIESSLVLTDRCNLVHRLYGGAKARIDVHDVEFDLESRLVMMKFAAYRCSSGGRNLPISGGIIDAHRPKARILEFLALAWTDNDWVASSGLASDQLIGRWPTLTSFAGIVWDAVSRDLHAKIRFRANRRLRDQMAEAMREGLTPEDVQTVFNEVVVSGVHAS